MFVFVSFSSQTIEDTIKHEHEISEICSFCERNNKHWKKEGRDGCHGQATMERRHVSVKGGASMTTETWTIIKWLTKIKHFIIINYLFIIYHLSLKPCCFIIIWQCITMYPPPFPTWSWLIYFWELMRQSHWLTHSSLPFSKIQHSTQLQQFSLVVWKAVRTKTALLLLVSRGACRAT